MLVEPRNWAPRLLMPALFFCTCFCLLFIFVCCHWWCWWFVCFLLLFSCIMCRLCFVVYGDLFCYSCCFVWCCFVWGWYFVCLIFAFRGVWIVCLFPHTSKAWKNHIFKLSFILWSVYVDGILIIFLSFLLYIYSKSKCAFRLCDINESSTVVGGTSV